MSAAWKKIKIFAKTNIRSELLIECVKIVLIYFVIGTLWIFLSDELTSLIAHDEKSRLMLSAGKGWFYVIITAVLLYVLIMRLLKKVDEAERGKEKSYRELQAVLQQQIALDEELRQQMDRVTESEKRLEYISYHDQLTGLYNRRYFEEILPYYEAETRLPLTIIMADINGLKLINDSFGHEVGDRLLKKAADIFRQLCPAGTLAARLAGDEFVLILPRTTGAQAMEKIKALNELATKEQEGSLYLSFALGSCTRESTQMSIKDVLKRADDEMYKQKLFESPSLRSKTVDTIITTLHEKNKREEQHSLRVSRLCEEMGKALNLSDKDVKELKTMGLLHDIGKIAIDEKILNKPGKLTDEEWSSVRRHPEIGYRILCTVSHMSEMADYVLAHHERWDGKGYPKGLKGEEIPLQSRIIAIADTYDAMVSERTYRKAVTKERAIEELRANMGTQFDEALVPVFIEKVLKDFSF